MNIPSLRVLNEMQIDEVKQYYAQLLGLRDWGINIIFGVKGTEMPERYADVSATPKKRRATIRLVHSDHVPSNVDPYDMELCLVHELVHVSHFAIDDSLRGPEGQKDSYLLEMVIEQHVEAVSWALVNQRRSGAHHFTWENSGCTI